MPRLISETIIEDYNKHIGNIEILPYVDTMGRREEYLREYLSMACKQAWRNKKYYKANKVLLKCKAVKTYFGIVTQHMVFIRCYSTIAEITPDKFYHPINLIRL